MKNKNKPISLILLSLSLLLLTAFFILFRSWHANSSDFSDIQNIVSGGNNYNLPPINLDLSITKAINYAARTRPLSNIRHLRELVNDFKINNNPVDNWIFLTKKRIEILQGYSKSDILRNYENLDQLINWHKEKRPKDWEFWKYKELESWEGGLAEIYLLTQKMIDDVNNKSQTETEKIEKLLPIAGALQQHQKRVDWTIKDWPLENEERKYLANMSNAIFSSLFDKIFEIVPIYNPGVYYYSFLPIIEGKNFGQYNLWFETNWFEEDKAELLVEIINSETNGVNYSVENRYGVSIGNVIISPETIEQMVKIQLPEGLAANTPPRIWLKKITDAENSPRIQIDKLSETKYSVKTENLSPGQEESLLRIKRIGWQLKEKAPLSDGVIEYIFTDWTKYIYLVIIMIFFCFILLLGLNYLEKVNLWCLFSKIIKRLSIISNNFFWFILSKIKISKENSSLLLIVYTIGAFLVGKNWDFLTIWTFIFLTLFSLIWRLSSNVHFILALFLMLSCPVFVILKMEFQAENLAIVSFFFLLSGAIQKISEERSTETAKIDKRLLLREIISCFLQFIIFSAVFAILFNLLIEIFFYKDFFGGNFVREFSKKVPLKLFALWLTIGIILKLVFQFVNKKAVKISAFFRTSGYSLKKIFTTVFYLSISIVSFFLLKNIRNSFKNNPFILKISENSASPGTLITIFGNNFLDNEGKVLINGTIQVVKNWENNKIIFEITDEFSNNGLVQVSNNYEAGAIESNGIGFTFIDTSSPVEYELDL